MPTNPQPYLPRAPFGDSCNGRFQGQRHGDLMGEADVLGLSCHSLRLLNSKKKVFLSLRSSVDVPSGRQVTAKGNIGLRVSFLVPPS